MNIKTAKALGFREIKSNNKTYYVFSVNKYPLMTSQEVNKDKELSILLYGAYLPLNDEQVANYIMLFKEAATLDSSPRVK
jgi:hypothetical protein